MINPKLTLLCYGCYIFPSFSTIFCTFSHLVVCIYAYFMDLVVLFMQ